MASALRELLQTYRDAAATEREKGEYFELLIKDFLKNDPIYANQFNGVWTFGEWAKANDKDARDTGIDLVAKLANGQGYCAIQCKFYSEDHRIQKKEIDSFFTASGKAPFTRRLIVDTTHKDWSVHAEEALEGQTIPTNRLTLSELEKSPIDWSVYAQENKIELQPKKALRDHQEKALEAVRKGLSEADRGKLIMACGTGKTFTSLKIAEELAGKGKRVLYLVPSLALMSQTVREWTNDTGTPLHAMAVCSDAQVGIRKAKDDLSDLNVHDLAYPATTDAQKLSEQFAATADANKMSVVFSTYQSIQVISDAQFKHEFPEFDLIICDEAHRTTGVTLSDADDSNFVKVHDQKYIKGKKRLYMTATPRVFGEPVRQKANEVGAELCSMDDESKYGKTLYEITFSHAVEKELLTDYKVIVLAVDEETVSSAVQNRLLNEDSELTLDDVTKIIGCYRALSKLDLRQDLQNDPSPMRRAVAFCKTIQASKDVTKEFAEVVEQYIEDHASKEHAKLHCELEHVDGTFNAKERSQLLDWLSEDSSEDTCRILSNARCLSEGVDVPSLDAIMFLHPRKSQVDVIQSVGRVMRRAVGKKMGYVVLPVGVPSGMTAEEALNDNEKYKVVWQILNALRSHDDRFDSYLNRIDLNEDIGKKIEIIVHSLPTPPAKDEKPDGQLGSAGGTAADDDDSTFDHSPSIDYTPPVQRSLDFDEFQKAILAKIVKKCGNVEYWEDWATDIAHIAQNHIARIKDLLKHSGSKEREAFDSFLAEIRDDLNDTITEDDAIEMLAQHIITQPIFDELFKQYSFTKHNPVSRAMQKVIDALQERRIDNENKSLEKFYHSVRLKIADIQTDAARQKLIVKLYDSFFKNAFPRTTEKLGIVYTPVEVVDFIIHSINDILQQEFNQTLGSEGVHIIDPFTGTGTFITRLLQSGLIKPEELAYKYQHEIHANEIVLLAYYIAAINIEAAFHGLQGGEYEPFEGICLTDTFQLYEKDDMVSKLFVDNSQRRQRQKDLDIRVIMGNPPYSAGQSSANDNNANVHYPQLDETIRDTYAKYTSATNKNALYDSYIRSFRWASDQLKEAGVIGFVTNAGWIDGNAMDGMRKCLAEEFSNLYIFHLRGNQRTSGELSRKEGGKIFGSGSRAPISINLLVKNPKAKKNGQIFFHDIGDYLSQKEKLQMIADFKSIKGIKEANGWQQITPDKHHDWLDQRDDSFDEFIQLGNKKDKKTSTVFENYSSGVKTNRDAWCYNFSPTKLENNMGAMIEFYNYQIEQSIFTPKNNNPKKISWDSTLIKDLEKGRKGKFSLNSIVIACYRPFCKQWQYYDRMFNNSIHLMNKVFPEKDTPNKVIAVSGTGSKEFSCLLMDLVPCLDSIEKGQCFPLKLYEKKDAEAAKQTNLLASSTVNEYTVKDGITDAALQYFRAAYPNEDIYKEDIFYYIYGLLHSEEYREKYADNLSRELPRIPCVKTAAAFWGFVEAGRKLGDLHVNYETVEPYPVTLESTAKTDADYYVKKMKFGGKGRDKDKSIIIYNDKIKLKDIPLEAYDYVVNGKPAIEWVMERQGVKTDKASGIVNDANDYALETMNDAQYPLKLLQSVITVSLETMKIVNNLPKLELPEEKQSQKVAS